MAISFPTPFDPDSKVDAGVYATGGRAIGLGLAGGTAINVTGDSVQDLDSHGKTETQAVVVVGPVGGAVSLGDGKGTGSVDVKALNPKKILKTVTNIVKHAKIKNAGEKGELPGFIGITRTKTASFSLRDLFALFKPR